jgi:hypothetical protein
MCDHDTIVILCAQAIGKARITIVHSIDTANENMNSSAEFLSMADLLDENVTKQGQLTSDRAKSILLRIQDSFSMTSTVIGYLMKLVGIDNYPVSLIAGDHRLYQLMEELSLVKLFSVSHCGKGSGAPLRNLPDSSPKRPAPGLTGAGLPLPSLTSRAASTSGCRPRTT